MPFFFFFGILLLHFPSHSCSTQCNAVDARTIFQIRPHGADSPRSPDSPSTQFISCLCCFSPLMTIGRNAPQRSSNQHWYFLQMRRAGIAPDHKEYIYFKVQWREHTEIKVRLMRGLRVCRNGSLHRRLRLAASGSLPSLVFRIKTLMIWPLGVRLQNDPGVPSQKTPESVSLPRIEFVPLASALSWMCFFFLYLSCSLWTFLNFFKSLHNAP